MRRWVINKALASLEHAAVLSHGDPLRAAWFAEVRARIAVQVGDKDLALEQLAVAAQNSAGVSYGNLKLDPLWDSLRAIRVSKNRRALAPKPADK